MPFMEFSDRDPTPKWDFQEPGARLKPRLRELSFGRHDTSTPVHKHGVKLYKALPLGTIGGSLADQFSEDQICSGQGFDLIIGAIRHLFRSYLEAEPEVQAEVALHQTMWAPKGTFVEYTSRISNKLREMESGFEEFLPPKLKGFIIKRQAKLTHNQAKHLLFLHTDELEQLRHLSSSVITGQGARRAIVRMLPDQQQKVKVSKAVRTLQDTNAQDLNITGVLQSVLVWTDKTDADADTWEAAIRHFNKVSVSSCFLMEIDKGCLQPSVFDDPIFGEYIGSLVKMQQALGTLL